MKYLDRRGTVCYYIFDNKKEKNLKMIRKKEKKWIGLQNQKQKNYIMDVRKLKSNQAEEDESKFLYHKELELCS